jgi:serine-type anaerobic sulfatase-maturating enzyme
VVESGFQLMPPLSVLFKTVSTDCNLDCSYCYYRTSLEATRARRRIDPAMLERFIPEYMEYVADVKMASMAWQGGEPTLAGLPFFERITSLQSRSARPGTVISNSLQTNAVLLTDEWGRFLKEHNFLVGVSLDGPRELHDRPRTYRNGRGTFDLVMRGVDVLRRYGVEFNVLCVIGPHNVRYANRLMAFFRSEGFSNIQFIPAMGFQASDPESPASYLITPVEYGEFLVAAFDLWYGQGAPSLSIRIFDNFLQSYLGIPNDLCVHADRCDAGIVVEYDGSVYPCDFYVHPNWKLGNVFEMSLDQIARSASRTAFMHRKLPLPEECGACEWLKVCKSGCPRNRVGDIGGDQPEYFSASYKRFFAHADSRLRDLKRAIENRWRFIDFKATAPGSARVLGRNDLCPCGSGRKVKRCCDGPAMTSYLFSR